MAKSYKKLFISLIALSMSMVCILTASCEKRDNKPNHLPGTGDNDNLGTKERKTITDITPEQYYSNGYTYNSVVGIDEFGRTIAPSSKLRDGEHEVGIFYFLCMGEHDPGAIYDNSKILAMENGLQLLTQTDNKYSKANAQHWWGEPLYGYYNSGDKWVIRRHLELFTHAGIDFIVFDVTNAVVYQSAYPNVLKTICEMKEEGWDVPQAVFYTNTNSEAIIESLYKSIYSKDKYKDAWYYMDGKPLIIGNYNKKNNISEFFTIRESQWPTEEFKENGFPWMEWTYPAPVHNGVINVCIAAHPELPMSYSLTHNSQNWGRGWDVNVKKNISENAVKGTYFQSTWDVALKEDPRMIFITGWNEWTVGKSFNEGYGEYIFVDCVNMEFSRDAEIMKGGYNDAFYIQTAINSRKYKSDSVADLSQFEVNHIDINSLDWNNVQSVFRDVGTNNDKRSYRGSSRSVEYKQDPARNNVVEIKVASDADNIYFRLQSTDNITAYEAGDSSWMNIFIGTGNVSQKGWESYEYVINRNIISEGTGSVEKLSPDFKGEILEKTASYRIDGNIMTVTVPREALGLAEDDNLFYFKFADNITNASDIMDYYVSGKSMPMGRLSYQYLG